MLPQLVAWASVLTSGTHRYRITADSAWQDKGWKMFEATEKSCKTTYAYAEISGMAVLPIHVLWSTSR